MSQILKFVVGSYGTCSPQRLVGTLCTISFGSVGFHEHHKQGCNPRPCTKMRQLLSERHVLARGEYIPCPRYSSQSFLTISTLASARTEWALSGSSRHCFTYVVPYSLSSDWHCWTKLILWTFSAARVQNMRELNPSPSDSRSLHSKASFLKKCGLSVLTSASPEVD